MHSEHVRIACLCCMHRLFKLSLTYPQNADQPGRVLGVIMDALTNCMYNERLFNVLCTAADALSEAALYCTESGKPPVVVIPLPELDKVCTRRHCLSSCGAACGIAVPLID